MQCLFFINDEDGLYSRVLIKLSEVPSLICRHTLIKFLQLNS